MRSPPDDLTLAEVSVGEAFEILVRMAAFPEIDRVETSEMEGSPAPQTASRPGRGTETGTLTRRKGIHRTDENRPDRIFKFSPV
jgi:hypothetical protein